MIFFPQMLAHSFSICMSNKVAKFWVCLRALVVATFTLLTETKFRNCPSGAHHIQDGSKQVFVAFSRCSTSKSGDGQSILSEPNSQVSCKKTVTILSAVALSAGGTTRLSSSPCSPALTPRGHLRNTSQSSFIASGIGAALFM